MPTTQEKATQMAYSNLIFIFFSFLLFSSTIAISPSQHPIQDDSNPDTDINKWCDTVPHPKSCKFFMARHKLGTYNPKKKCDFRKMIIEVAMDRARTALNHAWNWGRKCKTHKERAAWIDCVKLYDHTIIQLNRSLQCVTNNSSYYSYFDIQTWLSSALTNLETCRVGSEDMNVTGLIWPHVSYNVSDLISNGLAVNQGLIDDANLTRTIGVSDHGQEHPTWVGHGDRRLLRSSKKSIASRADFVVSKDGSGQYKTVQSAIDAAAKSRIRGRKVIYVKKGVYRENINVGPYNNDIMLVGQGMRYTVITGRRSSRGGYTTYSSATAGVDGLRFIARDITFKNDAGPTMGQAVALRSGSDLSVFYRCAFYGYQDTLFVHSQRQFYKMCYIYGTIDFIFGNAAVVFQNCIIKARKPVRGQSNVITAQARADPNQNTGIVIHSSRITAARDLETALPTVKTYLGRPWMQYSRTIIMKSYLDTLIDPVGWMTWRGDMFLSTLFYAEYGNFGPRSRLRGRVKWPGYHIITSRNVASKFTVGNFIAGREWLPDTGVPFSAGL